MYFVAIYALVVESADAVDSKSIVERRMGSSPIGCTKKENRTIGVRVTYLNKHLVFSYDLCCNNGIGANILLHCINAMTFRTD